MTIHKCATPSNWQALEYHEFADLNPETPPDQFEELKADIADNGPRVAVVLYEGQILDGRTRHRACVELGTAPEFAEFRGTADEARAFVFSMETRRHLSRDDRAKLVQKLRSEGRSLRGIADETGIPKSTVADLLNSGVRFRTPEPDALEPDDHAEAGGESSSPEPTTATVKGCDGKQYSATKPRKKKPHQKEAEERYGEVLDLVRQCSAALTGVMREDSEAGRRFRNYIFACGLGFYTNAYQDPEGEWHDAKDELLALRGVAFLLKEACKKEREHKPGEIVARWKANVANGAPVNPKAELHRARKGGAN